MAVPILTELVSIQSSSPPVPQSPTRHNGDPDRSTRPRREQRNPPPQCLGGSRSSSLQRNFPRLESTENSTLWRYTWRVVKKMWVMKTGLNIFVGADLLHRWRPKKVGFVGFFEASELWSYPQEPWLIKFVCINSAIRNQPKKPYRDVSKTYKLPSHTYRNSMKSVCCLC